MTLPTTSQFIKKYGLDAKKSLGQNFILDKNYTDKIAASAISKDKEDLSGEFILEVGPGPASLTRSILDLNPKRLVVVEKDPRCVGILKELQDFYGQDKLRIVNDDALKVDELQLLNLDKGEKFKIIANLPYNIATPLIIKWIGMYQNIATMNLMTQKEVAARIDAKKDSSQYGRLAILIQNFSHTKVLFDVSKSVFTPPPKVTSSIIQISPYDNPLNIVDVKKLQKITAIAFGQRRKMIRKSLQDLSDDIVRDLSDIGIDPSLRPENLSIKDFCFLTKFI